MKRRGFIGRLFGAAAVTTLAPAAMARDEAIAKLKQTEQIQHESANPVGNSILSNGLIYLSLWEWDNEADFKGYARQKTYHSDWDLQQKQNRFVVTNKRPIYFPICTGGPQMITHMGLSTTETGPTFWKTRLTMDIALCTGDRVEFTKRSIEYKISS